ncbi:protein CLT2, chloroplastic-like isoform X2 [Salvia miltiorrhiza]|nr:protein CLT2, chloroplastic-like isoform X2 [Salvia miltiorrhiza]
MLAVPKSPFVAIGFLEFLSSICGMYAGAMLPGPAIPLLYQTFLAWQLVFSSLLLGKRYYLNQIMGCFLVAAGVVVAVSRVGMQLLREAKTQAVDYLILLIVGACLGSLIKANDETFGFSAYTYTIISV